MSYIFNILVIILIGIVLLISKKYKIFLDNKIDKHKKYVGKKNSYFIGGLIIFTFLLYEAILKSDFYFLLFYFSFFVIGFCSDLKLLNNPNKRLLIQFIILLPFIVLLDIQILETRLIPIDTLLKYNAFNYFFVVFCLLVLINGSNFVDGINSLLISYVLIIFILMLINFTGFINNAESIKNLSYIVFILLIFNLFGILILGDSGSYLLSLYLGLHLIEFSNSSILISPYFVVLLLWYPCFELLFSIIRRQINGLNSYNPDTQHLHQMIYKYVSSKNNLEQNTNHFITTFIIIIYNLFSFIIAFKFYYHTDILVYLIVNNVIVYVLSYNFLKAKIR